MTAPLIVDALGWRRVLGPGENVQPPEAALSRGLEVHPHGVGEELELWIDPRYVDAGYGWSFPARDELRIGVGSFDPHDPVKQPTLRLVEDVDADARRLPGQLDPAPHPAGRPRTACSSPATAPGHCLPLTAEGIRTAFYFGIALGRELRAVLEGRQDRAAALDRYGDFCAAHRWKFEAMYLAQQSIRHLHGRPLDTLTRSSRAHACRTGRSGTTWRSRRRQFAVPAPAAARCRAASRAWRSAYSNSAR